MKGHPHPGHHIVRLDLQRSVAEAPLQRECIPEAQADHAVDPLHRVESLVIEAVRLVVRQGPLASDPSREDGPALSVRPRVAHEGSELARWDLAGELLRLGRCPRLGVVDVGGGGEERLDGAKGDGCTDGDAVGDAEARGDADGGRGPGSDLRHLDVPVKGQYGVCVRFGQNGGYSSLDENLVIMTWVKKRILWLEVITYQPRKRLSGAGIMMVESSRLWRERT